MGAIQTVDLLKRQALSELVKNVPLFSAHILSTVNNYINIGSSSIVSFPEITPTYIKRLSASDFNAKIALAYLDLYAIFILNFANVQMFNSLQKVTISKYEFILNQFKVISSLINMTSLSKAFRYNIYTNFSTLNYIYNEAFYDDSFGVGGYSQLSYSTLLSLPITSSSQIYPQEILTFINDSATSIVESESSESSILSIIKRTYGNKVGIINPSKAISSSNNGPVPTVSGTTNGYISDSLFIKITSLKYDELGEFASYSYSSSVDNINWSTEEISAIKDEIHSISLFNGLSSGIQFNFNLIDTLVENDTITIPLQYMDAGIPNCLFKIIFNMIYHISYLQYEDISPFKLKSTVAPVIKNTETSIYKEILFDIDREIDHIIPINNTIYSLDLDLRQDRYSFGNNNNKMSLDYIYNLDNITAYRNQYSQFGAIVFNPIEVTNITTVSLNSKEYIKNINTHNQKAFIKHSIVVDNIYGRSTLGIVPVDFYDINTDLVEGTDTSPIYNYLDPCMSENYYNNISTTSQNETSIDFNLNYKIDDNVYSLHKIGSTEDLSNPIITSGQPQKVTFVPDINSFYTLNYRIPIKRSSDLVDTYHIDYDDTNWILTSNKTVYTLYKDINDNNSIKLAIRSLGNISDDGTSYTLLPFTGTIYSKIFMLSADENYTSPYVLSYSLSAT